MSGAMGIEQLRLQVLVDSESGGCCSLLCCECWRTLDDGHESVADVVAVASVDGHCMYEVACASLAVVDADAE